MALAIPNELLYLGSPFFGLISLIPLYLAISYSKTYKRAFWLLFIHGCFTHLLSSFWLGNFQDFALFTLGASDLGTGFYEGLMGMITFMSFRFCNKNTDLRESSGRISFMPSVRIISFAAAWTYWEYTKSTGFLAYPWGTLSMTAYKWPLITQIAAVTGPYGVSFLFALFSALTAEGIILFQKNCCTKNKKIIFQSWIHPLRFTCALFALTVIYGIIEYNQQRYPIKKMNTVLVQMNLDPWEKGDYEAIRISQKLTEKSIEKFTREGMKCDLVVWSEGVLNRRLPEATYYYEYIPYEESLSSFINRMDTPFIIGGPTIINSEKKQYGNSANIFNRYGSYSGSYVKMHLVPFAEKIPGVQYQWVQDILKKIHFGRGWTEGTKYVLFEVPVQEVNTYAYNNYKIYSLIDDLNFKRPPSVKISTPICFDDAFGEVCRGLYLSGSECFVNITNDSWSLTKSAEYQHFVVAHYRAIEYRTTLVRSTNGGVSCVIDPAGKVLCSMPLFQEDSMAVQVPVYKRQMTTYARYGNWLPKVIIFILMILFIYMRMLEIEIEKQGISTHAIYYSFEALEFMEKWPLDMNEWNW